MRGIDDFKNSLKYDLIQNKTSIFAIVINNID